MNPYDKPKVSWALVTAPIIEPITLSEAKQHARMTQDNDDATFARFIQTAREAAEDCMSRGLLTQTWKMTLDQFYDRMYLPRAAPLQSITSIQYYDGTGSLQTLATSVYDFDDTSRPACIVLKRNQVWPALDWIRFTPRVIVTYVIGWTAPSLVPERIKQGIRLYVAAMDCDREGGQDFADGVKAAEACWTDWVKWIEPEYWCDYYNYR